MTSVKELAYIGFEVSDIRAWTSFATELVGMRPGAREDGLATFRLDDRVHRILVEQGPADDLAYCGYECHNEADLDVIVNRLKDNGHTVADGDSALAGRRGVDRIVVTKDPAGNRIELCVGLQAGDVPSESTLSRSGFVTADGGAGHMALVAMDPEAMVGFYSLLGFTLSDYINMTVAPQTAVPLTFMHCNGRHHTLAFAPLPLPKKIHHFMVEVNEIVDVGLAYDRFLDAKAPLQMTLGMHPNDRMLSFYAETPSAFAMEFGSGGVLIKDEARWQVETYEGISTWGHSPPAALAAALSA